MRFDIARKIVKFKNGQFGIRRWTPFGYQFLDLRRAPTNDFWWLAPDYVAKSAAGTEELARERLRVYLLAPDAPGYDKGRPV